MDNCTCLSISRDPFCAWHGDLDKVESAEVDRLKLQLTAAEGRILHLESELRGATQRMNAIYMDALAETIVNNVLQQKLQSAEEMVRQLQDDLDDGE